MTGRLILQRLGEDQRSLYRTSPFVSSSDFTKSWWTPGGSLVFGDQVQMFNAIRESDGVEVARAKIDADRDGPYIGYGVPESSNEFAEIQFIEVSSSCRRQGYGKAFVKLLIDEFSDVNLIAGSEADGFWGALGWTVFRSLQDPLHQRKLYIHWAQEKP